jgi:hypothetical protein
MTKDITHISNLWVQRAVRLCALILACLVGFAHSLYGQAWLPPRGEGNVTLAYQHINVRDHFRGDGSRVDLGRIYSHSLLLLADYGLTDSLAVNLSVPYVRAKYVGETFYAHNPALLAFPNNARFLDDGAYHGSLQDVGFGVRYNIATRPVTLTPFVGANLPSHDYPFFAHAAPGRNLRQLVFGANVGGQIESFLPRSYFHGRYSYGVTERVKIEGQSYGGNQSLIRTEFGHFFTPRLALKAIQTASIAHGGNNVPDAYLVDGAFDVTSQQYYHHDQIDAVSSLELGGGADFALSRSNGIDLSGSLIHSVWGRNGHALHVGLAVGLTWSFPRPRRPDLPPPTSPNHPH